jgi:hypothetical protein
MGIYIFFPWVYDPLPGTYLICNYGVLKEDMQVRTVLYQIILGHTIFYLHNIKFSQLFPDQTSKL